MNADFCTFLAMPKENIGTHAATCDRVCNFSSSWFPVIHSRVNQISCKILLKHDLSQNSCSAFVMCMAKRYSSCKLPQNKLYYTINMTILPYTHFSIQISHRNYRIKELQIYFQNFLGTKFVGSQGKSQLAHSTNFLKMMTWSRKLLHTTNVWRGSVQFCIFCNFWRTDRPTDRHTDRPTDLEKRK